MNRVYELAEGNKILLVRKLLHEGSPERFVGGLSGRHRQQNRLLKFEAVNRIKTIV
ncbi:MAG: hypothetical protein ACLFVR_09955 [Thiohalospira sp.]